MGVKRARGAMHRLCVALIGVWTVGGITRIGPWYSIQVPPTTHGASNFGARYDTAITRMHPSRVVDCLIMLSVQFSLSPFFSIGPKISNLPVNKSVLSFLLQLTTWHCSQLLLGAAVQQSIAISCLSGISVFSLYSSCSPLLVVSAL